MEQLGLEGTLKGSFSSGKAPEGWIGCPAGCRAARCALGGTQLQGELRQRGEENSTGKSRQKAEGMSSAPN